ncbi:MAG: SCO family protein [Acetobacteraceae bacterium]|nr:SCO family protein [Acetobacteraceae bacterium]
MKRWLIALFWLMLATAVQAAPEELQDYFYDQRPGNTLPARPQFKDERGAEVALSRYAGGPPLIVLLGYFHCPNLCGLVRGNLLEALSNSGLVPGRDYRLIALSIDPAETSQDAAAAKQTDLARYPLPGADAAWHYLTGRHAAIGEVADVVGFRYRFQPEHKQFIHPAGIVFATPAGVISSYLLGVGYSAGDVRLGVTRANEGSVAAKALPILLLCFHYDPATGRYSLAIMKVLRLASAITVLTIGGTLFLAFRRERRGA